MWTEIENCNLKRKKKILLPTGSYFSVFVVSNLFHDLEGFTSGGVHNLYAAALL